MKGQGDILVTLVVQFSLLSLLAFGGANGVVPEMQRQAVEVRHWMTSAEFTSLFAIAQAAPGPNFMISTLVGWKAAGLPGALVATLAMCAPSCLLSYWVDKAWDRARGARWRVVTMAALAPVTVGLVSVTALYPDQGGRSELEAGSGEPRGGGGRLPQPAQSPLAPGRRRWAGAGWGVELSDLRRVARDSTTFGPSVASPSSWMRKVARTSRAC